MTAEELHDKYSLTRDKQCQLATPPPSLAEVPFYRQIEPVAVVRPHWEELGKFLAKRRHELSKEMGQDLPSPMALRSTTNRLPARWSNHRTISTLEDGRPLSIETLFFLPEMYRVGLQEIFEMLLPEYMEAYNKAADRMASMPWLGPLVVSISDQPESVLKVFQRMTEGTALANQDGK